MNKMDFPAARSFALNPTAEPGSPEALAPYQDYGDRLYSTDRYVSRDWASREWENMWTRIWTLAGVAKDIPEVGDWFRYDLGPESFIVTRFGAAPGDIAAYYNVCHHRGNRLVMSEFGHASSFKCAFHSWEWNLDGTLKNIQDRETFRAPVVEDDPPLTPVRCEIWDGFIFINMDMDAEPLLDFLGPVVDHLKAYRFADMHVVKDLETPWPCNWKIGHDAFIEVYHVHAVHPEILSFFNDREVQWDTYPNGMSRQLLKFGEISPKVDDHETLNEGLKYLLSEVDVTPEQFVGRPNDARRVLQEAKRAWADKRGIDYSAFTDNQLTDDWNYSIFPNITFNAHPEGLLIQRFRPHRSDPEKMTYDLMVLIRPVDDPNYKVPAYMGVEDGTDLSGKIRPERMHIEYGSPGLGYVINQDATMMGYVHQGVQSRGYKGARYSDQEQQLRHWHNELERYVRGEK
jgi:phenylpropionate dioxygenase-like ring-hydroxylating dioxygenase large terminal subunit